MLLNFSWASLPPHLHENILIPPPAPKPLDNLFYKTHIISTTHLVLDYWICNTASNNSFWGRNHKVLGRICCVSTFYSSSKGLQSMGFRNKQVSSASALHMEPPSFSSSYTPVHRITTFQMLFIPPNPSTAISSCPHVSSTTLHPTLPCKLHLT